MQIQIHSPAFQNITGAPTILGNSRNCIRLGSLTPGPRIPSLRRISRGSLCGTLVAPCLTPPVAGRGTAGQPHHDAIPDHTTQKKNLARHFHFYVNILLI